MAYKDKKNKVAALDAELGLRKMILHSDLQERIYHLRQPSPLRRHPSPLAIVVVGVTTGMAAGLLANKVGKARVASHVLSLTIGLIRLWSPTNRWLLLPRVNKAPHARP